MNSRNIIKTTTDAPNERIHIVMSKPVKGCISKHDSQFHAYVGVSKCADPVSLSIVLLDIKSAEFNQCTQTYFSDASDSLSKSEAFLVGLGMCVLQANETGHKKVIIHTSVSLDRFYYAGNFSTDFGDFLTSVYPESNQIKAVIDYGSTDPLVKYADSLAANESTKQLALKKRKQ